MREGAIRQEIVGSMDGIQIPAVALACLITASAMPDAARAAGCPADGEADLRACGAAGDGQTDDTEALARWWAAAVKSGYGHIPAGTFIVRASDLDLLGADRKGVTVRGHGAQRSVFSVKGGGLRFVCSCKAVFYMKLAEFGVHADTPGPALALGRVDFSDAINSSTFEDIVINNDRNAADAVGFESNGVYASDFRNVVANNAGKGTALMFRQTQFSRFQGAGGHADVGLALTAGWNFGNTFSGVDLEAVDTDVVIDSPHSAKNVFLGNQYVWRKVAVNATAGVNNVFIAPNFATAIAADAFAGTVGVSLMGDYGRLPPGVHGWR